MFKKIFALLVAIVLILSLGACAKKTETISVSDEEINTAKEAAVPIAKQFLSDLFNGDFIKTDAASAISFESFCKDFFANETNEYGIFYKDGKITWDDMEFASVNELIEFLADEWSDSVECGAELVNFRYFLPEMLSEAIENLDIQESMLMPLDDISIEAAASAEFTVSVKMDDDEQAGLITVFMLKIDGEWKVYSPSLPGLLFGFGYFR